MGNKSRSGSDCCRSFPWSGIAALIVKVAALVLVARGAKEIAESIREVRSDEATLAEVQRVYNGVIAFIVVDAVWSFFIFLSTTLSLGHTGERLFGRRQGSCCFCGQIIQRIFRLITWLFFLAAIGICIAYSAFTGSMLLINSQCQAYGIDQISDALKGPIDLVDRIREILPGLRTPNLGGNSGAAEDAVRWCTESGKVATNQSIYGTIMAGAVLLLVAEAFMLMMITASIQRIRMIRYHIVPTDGEGQQGKVTTNTYRAGGSYGHSKDRQPEAHQHVPGVPV